MTPYAAGPPSPHDPFRDPAWRHLRAAHLVDQGRRPVRRDDAWVRLAWRHLRWLARAGRAEPPTGLLDAHRAWSLRRGGGPPRWHLEAQLLTGEGVAESARRCGLEPGVVEAYAMLYHDVLHLLHRRGYIANRLLPRRAALGVRPHDVGGLLKLAAWRGGPVALEQALRVLSGRGVPRERLGSLTGQELEDACGELHCRFWLLRQTLPLEAFRPGRARRLQAVQEALVDLDTVVHATAEQEAGRACGESSVWLARWVIMEEAEHRSEAALPRPDELLALLHGVLDAIEGEYVQRAA